MNLKKIFKNRHGGVDTSEIAGMGKSGGRIYTRFAFFVPIATFLSALIMIVAVVGIPTSMDVLKHTLDSVLGGGNGHEQLKESAPEVLFEDVGSDSKYYDALVYLKKSKIMNGYQDNTFRPFQELKRAEMVKLIVSAKNQFPLQLNYNSCFKDVDNQWFAASVCLAKEKNWINGFEDGTFQPEKGLTRAEGLKMLIEAFGIKANSTEPIPGFDDVKSDSWYYNYVQVALDNGLLNENPELDLFQPDSPMNRGDAAKIIYRILLLQ